MRRRVFRYVLVGRMVHRSGGSHDRERNGCTMNARPIGRPRSGAALRELATRLAVLTLKLDDLL
jgi:hypothetical protein